MHMEHDAMQTLAKYNQGRIKGKWGDILDAVYSLENELAASQAAEHQKRCDVIRAFIERNGGDIADQRERAEKVAKRIQQVVLLKQDALTGSEELAGVMRDLNDTARMHGMIVRLLIGDEEALQEISCLSRKRDNEVLENEIDDDADADADE